MSDRPTPETNALLNRELAGEPVKIGDWTDFARTLERQRDAYAETLREFLSLCAVYQKINSEHLEGIIRDRHPELAQAGNGEGEEGQEST